MAANFIKWEIPLFVTTDGIYHAIICRGSKDLSQSATNTIALDTFRYFEQSDIVIQKHRDLQSRMIGVELTDLLFIDDAKYTGTSNGSPVEVDLTSEGLSLFKHIVNDRSLLYTLWIRRKKSNGDLEYMFCGDFKRKDVKFDHQSIHGESSVNMSTTGLCSIKCAPLKRRLEEMTIGELIDSFTDADTPERGGGDTAHVFQPFYAGLRPNPNYLPLSEDTSDVSIYGTEAARGSYNLHFNNLIGNQFDYSVNIGNYTGDPLTKTPFPSEFWGVSFYTTLNKLFSHSKVNIAFDTSSYDAPCFQLGKQTWNTTSLKYDKAFSAQTLQNIYLNFNVNFGIDPRPIGRSLSVNASTDTFTSLNLPGGSAVNHHFNNGDELYFFAPENTGAGGALPGGITRWQKYYVINKTNTTFQVSLTSGGSAVDVTSTGTLVFAFPPMWMETPNTLARDVKAVELIKKVATQFGYFCEYGVTQTGPNAGKPTIYFRQRFQTPPTTFPLTKLAGKNAVKEEPLRKPMVIRVTMLGDEDEVYTPRLPHEDDVVQDVNLTWRIKPLATPQGFIFGQHLKLNDSISYEEQIKCIYGRRTGAIPATDDTYYIHEYSHIAGAHLFYFDPKNTTNAIYPANMDNSGQHYQDSDNYEGFKAYNLVRFGTDDTTITESLMEFMAWHAANDLLRGQYALRIKFKGVVDGSNSSLTIKPLTEYSTRYETALGVARDFYVDKVFMHLKARVTEVIVEEQPTSYTLDTSFPIARKKGSGNTTGQGRPGSSTSGNNQTGGPATEVYLVKSQNSDIRNISQSNSGDYYNLIFRPYNGSATKDLLRFESADGATLRSKFNVNGEFHSYRQAAININPFGTSAGNTGEVRWYELVGSNYVGFKAADALTGDTIYTLPTAFPGGTYVLQSTTAGVMSWVNPATLFDSSTLVTKSPATIDRNLIIATADNVEALAIKRYSGSSAGVYTLSIFDSAGIFKVGVDDSMRLRSDGGLYLGGLSSPIQLNGAAGASNQVLTSQGSGNTPAWASISSLYTDAVIINPGSSSRNTTQPTGDFIAQIWKNSASQTANLNEWQTSGGSVMSSVSKDGYFRINDSNSVTAALHVTQPAALHGLRIKTHSSTGSNDGHPVMIMDNASSVHLFTLNDVGAISMGSTTAPSSSRDPLWRMNQATLGNALIYYSSTATNDDPYYEIRQNRATTTDATVTTLHTVSTSSDTIIQVEARVIARRTGGTGGTAGDGAGYVIIGTFKNVGGTLSQIGATTILHTAESQAGWNCTFDVSGTSIRVRVTGALNNNVTWHLFHCKISSVGS